MLGGHIYELIIVFVLLVGLLAIAGLVVIMATRIGGRATSREIAREIVREQERIARERGERNP